MPLNLIDAADATRLDGSTRFSCAPVARCDPGLADLFEHVSDAIHVADGSGRVIFQNRRLVLLLEVEPDACRILDELRRVVARVWSRTFPSHAGSLADSTPRCASGVASSEIRTDSALYRMHGTLVDERSLHSPPLAVVVVAILGESGAPSAERLRKRFGLSPREVEVARLLADGLSTRELSAMLRVSTHTARHHTENVMRKLRVRRRAEVGRRLRGG
jgi:DNA-binding CsgD family transcriptional regulator